MSEAIDGASFKEAMSRLGAAVHVVTTDGAAGRHGLTASAVCSVTDTPPIVLVCVNRGSGAYAAIRENGVLCVNILAGRHEHLSDRFGRKGVDVEDRFAAGAWRIGTTGSPALTDAVVNLDCNIDQIVEMGTHGVFFCRVVSVDIDDRPEGLIYFNRAYHHLGQPPEASSP